MLSGHSPEVLKHMQQCSSWLVLKYRDSFYVGYDVIYKHAYPSKEDLVKDEQSRSTEYAKALVNLD